MSNSSFVRLATIGVLAMSLALSACGRKGPLDPPPRASAQPADQQAAAPAAEQPADPAVRQAQSGWPFGQSNAPDDFAANAPKGEKKSFFLDWLID